MLSFFDLIAVLLVLSALFGWINHRYVHLPNSVGLLVMGLVASLAVAGVGVVFPGSSMVVELTAALRQIDFSGVVMNGMLAFLLFAGALGLDVSALRDRAGPVALLAVLGTLLSTVIVGVAFWLAAGALGHPLSLPWALVFGALISPTDPIAVLAMLKGVKLPDEISIELQGESLFNDGVGVVLFLLLLGYAAGAGDHIPTVGSVAVTVLQEIGGGILLGVVAGYIAYRGLRAIDDFAVETLITLALVTGLYALAQRLGASGPLAVVAAGLLVGHRDAQHAMTDTTRRYVTTLWTLIDEILNSVLFLLIGLEVLVLTFAPGTLVVALAAVPIALVARLFAVAAPLLIVPWSKRLSVRNVPFLTWAGLRGGISVALVLALPDDPAKPVILAATYAVVLFTLIVQGSTIGLVARHTLRSPLAPEPAGSKGDADG
ncbi:MAG: sodium:proton antiporter [Caldimonas sp.]